MKTPHEKFCVLPWVSLEASPIGTVRPCCLADDEIVDNNNVKFNLKTANFNEIQNSQNMQKLREEFLANKQPQTCRKCWNEERAGRTSKRMHTLDRLKHIVTDTEWTVDAKPLVFLDLKLGNICNLKCRICGSWSSSQFATEDLRQLPREEQKESFAYEMLRAGAWPRESTKFWEEVDQQLEHIRYIEFTGGEPFMIKEHFQMLQGIIDRGIAGNVEIHYNTNGTLYPEEAEQIWKHFKLVEIAISIDDLEERFEYQRSNANWVEVYANLQRFKNLKETNSNIVLQLCSTVNVFNIYYIDQLAHWIDRNKESFQFVYWNVMHDAWYFSISTLPDTVKQQLTTHILNKNLPDAYRDEIVRIVEFMNKGASTDGFMTCLKIRDLDNKRNQDFAVVAPEMAELIGYKRHA